MKREHNAVLRGEEHEGSGLGSPSKRRAAADEKMDIRIEVYMTPTSIAQPRRVEEQVLTLLQRRAGAYVEGMRIECDEQAEAALGNDVEAINACEIQSARVMADADAPVF